VTGPLQAGEDKEQRSQVINAHAKVAERLVGHATGPSPVLHCQQGQCQTYHQPVASAGAGLKAVWYAAEAFGKAVGGNRADRESIVTSAAQVCTKRYYVLWPITAV
jgi:hypothetical protein